MNHSQHERGHDRWQWRRRVRSNPALARVYRIGVAVLGLVVVIVGIILLPFPGPGWVVIFLGLGIWASEFEWARSLLAWVRERVEGWWRWLEVKGWWAKMLAAVGTGAIVLGVFWVMFALSGVPGWLPASVRDLLASVPGLG